MVLREEVEKCSEVNNQRERCQCKGQWCTKVLCLCCRCQNGVEKCQTGVCGGECEAVLVSAVRCGESSLNKVSENQVKI